MNTQAAVPDFRLSSDSRALAAHLRDVRVGDLVTYATLAGLIGRSVQRGPGTNALQTARRILIRDHRMVFGTVRKEGLRRLDDAEITQTGRKTREHVRRQSRAAMRRISCADYTNLTQQQRLTHNAEMAVFGVLAQVATDRGVARLEHEIQKTGPTLPVVAAAISALRSVS